MEFTAASGALVVINKAPFEAAKNLWNAVQNAAANERISIDFINQPESLLNLVLKIDSSPAFNAALWPCLVRCLRDNKKIDKTTFEDVEACKEYYEIVVPCVKENIGPFVGSLFSELNKALAQVPSAQPVKSAPESA